MEGPEGQARQKVARVHQPGHSPDLPARGPLQRRRDVAQLRDPLPREPEVGQGAQELRAGGARVELRDLLEDARPDLGLFFRVVYERRGRARCVRLGELGELGAAELVALVVEALEEKKGFFFVLVFGGGRRKKKKEEEGGRGGLSVAGPRRRRASSSPSLSSSFS